MTPPWWTRVREQVDDGGGHRRCRRTDQLGDADDVGDPGAGLVAAACLDPQRADATLGVGRAEHRAAGP